MILKEKRSEARICHGHPGSRGLDIDSSVVEHHASSRMFGSTSKANNIVNIKHIAILGAK